MPRLVFIAGYERREKKFLKKHPELLGQYGKTLKLLSLNPSHPSLRLHKLQGLLSECFSVSINLTYRIVLKFIVKDDMIIPIDIGKHD